jgi:intron-binding protein aquarius
MDSSAANDNAFAELARKHWLNKKKVSKVQAKVVKDELWDPLEKDNFAPASLLELEALQLLEKYLWPGFNGDTSNQHVLLLVLLINIKRRENLPTWALFSDRPQDFSALFHRILSLLLDTNLSIRIRTQLLVTIIGAFEAIDIGIIRKECAPLVSIAIWQNLHSEAARELLLEKHAQFKKVWRTTNKRYDGADDSAKVRMRFERSWLYTLLLDFLSILYASVTRTTDDLIYCERFLELLCDLQSQFPTRRYVNTLLQDLNLLVAIKQAPSFYDGCSGMLRDLYNLLRHYTCFPIDDHTGRQLSAPESAEAHASNLARLQRTALKHFKEKLTLLSLSNHGLLAQREELKGLLEPLSDAEIQELVNCLGLRAEYPKAAGIEATRAFLLEILLLQHEKSTTFRDSLQAMPILPTESILYEASFLRNETYNGARPLAIPKLNLQYLSVGDFLWRAFILFRYEAFYEVRKDLEETLKRLQPKKDFSTGQTRFSGSSRMALQIPKPAIIEVIAPRVGEEVPAEVRAEIILDVSRLPDHVRKEWEALRPDDVVFLLGVQHEENKRTITNGGSDGDEATAPPFQHMRAAEVIQVMDDNGKPLRFQAQENGYQRRPKQRRILVKLDTSAYQEDVANVRKGQKDVLENINVIVRRRSRENNFKPMLDSIRRLATSNVELPAWLQDVFLGLGDPAGATYKRLPNALKRVDFRDTFLNWEHLVESLPGKSVHAQGGVKVVTKPPFVLDTSSAQSVDDQANPAKKRKRDEAGASSATATASEKASASNKSSKKRRRDDVEDTPVEEAVAVSTYTPTNMGPYTADEPKSNTIRFTPAQVEAITSGTQPGLTVIVGPPGTGKTDVATQIINNIYHNFPNERTLLVAHSNQALNQLFQKIVALDIDERHLLRLGHGEGELQLDNEANYSKHGRVESFLENGGTLLAEVTRLAATLNAPGAHGSSCETAGYFNTVYVKPAWIRYELLLQSVETTAEQLEQAFPFTAFFANAPKVIFPADMAKDAIVANVTGCYRHIEKLFSELEDIRPFEVLRNARDRANYLLIKEARIIAMTSTHAAMRRQEIADLGFVYDNVVMEEAAQITEVENFIPLALQKTKNNAIPLKRVIMCGDHLQNSPIVQNLAFRQYANLEQSLFLRLVRLGVPTILLDKQGRARSSIAALYRWRYQQLGNLPVVETSAEYQQANPGLRHDFQFINVPDYKGKGETEPSPHFIQNLGEAEYAVALYMFMRLLGYPASKITILTTYAGQRALIKDVLQHRCAKNRLFGLPRMVTTVDKYQGEQNDCTCYAYLCHMPR